MDNQKINNLYYSMISYYKGDAKRICHFTKVHSFAKLIGESEGISEKDLFVLEAAALVHDIGIKIAEEKYHSSSGKYQEIEGPPEARKMLLSLCFDEKIIRRVEYLVAHHHTYNNIDSIDYQILVEADFIVNLYEDTIPKQVCIETMDKIFKTSSGKKIVKEMFGL